jgi:hypothetical protein
MNMIVSPGLSSAGWISFSEDCDQQESGEQQTRSSTQSRRRTMTGSQRQAGNETPSLAIVNQAQADLQKRITV